jgi:uncharacterized protein
MKTTTKAGVSLALFGILLAAPWALAQRGGPMGRGRGADPTFAADRATWQFLLQHRSEIDRQVTKIDGGVETVTESKNSEVAAAIQEHVPAMARRVKEQDPVHLRDPLFAELFRHAGKIKLTYELTASGVRATEVSEDPYVARLIQAHAEVVSRFLKHGPAEVHTAHELPPKAAQNEETD